MHEGVNYEGNSTRNWNDCQGIRFYCNIEFKEYDLTKGQYLYLVRICENPGIIQEKLAEMIKVDRTTAARAIKKLEMNGFIEKKDDKHNKKIKKLFPTDKGKKIYPFIIRENEYSNMVALAGFSESEIETIFNYLQRVRKNIEIDWEFVKKGTREIIDYERRGHIKMTISIKKCTLKRRFTIYFQKIWKYIWKEAI